MITKDLSRQRSLLLCVDKYHGSEPSRQLRGDEHGAQRHRQVEERITVGGLPQLVADDALQAEDGHERPLMHYESRT